MLGRQTRLQIRGHRGLPAANGNRDAAEGAPKFCVDVTDVWERKEKLLACYASQSNVNMHALAASHVWGPMIGARYAEAFTMHEAVGVADLFHLT